MNCRVALSSPDLVQEEDHHGDHHVQTLAVPDCLVVPAVRHEHTTQLHHVLAVGHVLTG